MLDRKRGLYLPSEFDPENFCTTGDSMEPKNMFKTRVFHHPALPNFHPYRYVMHVPRFTGPSGIIITMMLIFVDGHCTNEGSVSASAGYGFAYSAKVSQRGVTKATPKPEGWEAIVIATSKGYVYDSIMGRVQLWVDKDWRLEDGSVVPDWDLWRHLLYLLKLYALHGCEMMFWCIDAGQNKVAAAAAKVGASMPQQQEWTSVHDPALELDEYFNF
ncbi:hypothetical protein SLS62_005111 [Diatrype stigma]|uniref:RNase H type-1 domain-containing protein n=1 Tax=Diatrype stigma TaxID=117547 RepID=A0AAN9UTL4_9PEZI